MQVSRFSAYITAIVMGLSGAVATHADVLWTASEGTSAVAFDTDRLDASSLSVELLDGSGSGMPIAHASLTIDASSTLTLSEQDGIPNGDVQGQFRHVESLVIRSPLGEYMLEEFVITAITESSSTQYFVGGRQPAFELRDMKMGFDRVGQTFLLEGAEMVVTEGLAEALGAPELVGTSLGSFVVQSSLEWTAGGDPFEQADLFDPEPRGGTMCGREGGPDVIVGDLPNVSNYSSQGGIEAYAVGTTSCNVGDTVLRWVASTNQHPVIGQNMYRLKDDRFELIGISWLKHGFTALTGNICQCGCNPPGTGSLLGVGCSDPYSSGLNGRQTGLGPRFEVNAHTGFFLYPFTAQGQSGASTYKRLQVHISDLDPAQDGGGTYFVEGHYVTPDDAAANRQDNNASYRKIGISGGGSTWTASFSGQPATVRELPAIRAWAASSSDVVETEVRDPENGLIILAAKASMIPGPSDMWHYEYAVHNLNSDKSVGSFSVPVPAGATVANIGFHDVDYHSGEPYSGTDWPGVHSGGAVTWSTESFATNPDANALRWGTLYNFRFDSDASPDTGDVTLGMFKPTTPSSVSASTVVPTGVGCTTTAACPDADVNCDNVADGFDIAVIRAPSNWLLSTGAAAEPRADVNGDGTVDGFDIADIRAPACWLQ